MKILFDQGTPAPLRKALADHVVETAFERGWSTLQNGTLIRAAEAAGFEVFVTTDRNLRYQQALSERNIAIVVLMTTSWPRIERNFPACAKPSKHPRRVATSKYRSTDCVDPLSRRNQAFACQARCGGRAGRRKSSGTL